MARRMSLISERQAAAALPIALWLCVAGAAAPAAAQPAAAASGAAAAPSALRVCADPDNLPFTAQEGATKGLYIELAELVGRKLEMPVAYTWWYTHYQRRAMRNTILANECDAMFALPASAEYRHRGVQKSRPFLEVGYAIVAAPGFPVTSLDALKGKRIAVQFSSTPHVLLSSREGFTTVTFKEPGEVFTALAKGEADAALLWGPVAGYLNKLEHQGRWKVTPVAGHELSGQVVVGVRADKAALKARIDQALIDLEPQIQELAAKYGFPTGKAVNLESRMGSAAPLRLTLAHAAAGTGEPGAPGETGKGVARVPASLWQRVASHSPAPGASAPQRRPAAAQKPAGKPAAAAATPVAVAAPAAPPPLDPVAQAGRTRFNDQCSHCHGADGATPIRERDVRRLSIRYDADKWQQVALKTIREGRPDLGMPTWKESLSEQNIKELVAFLTTIQK